MHTRLSVNFGYRAVCSIKLQLTGTLIRRNFFKVGNAKTTVTTFGNKHSLLQKQQVSHFSNGISDSVVWPKVQPTNVWDMLIGYQKYQLLTLTVKLGIYDKIAEYGTEVDVAKLADDLSLVKGNLERILNACSSMGLLIRRQDETQVMYSNSPEAMAYLTRNSPFSYCPFLDLDSAMVNQLYTIEESVKGQVTDAKEGLYKMIMENKEMFLQFMKRMECVAKEAIPLIIKLELDNFKHIVDLGGCLGQHARTLKSHFKNSDVTLAEFPPVIQQAMELEENKTAGINFTPCNFFDGSTLPKADLYVISHILSNWNDDQCQLILNNVYSALNDGGAILVLDKILYDNKDGPSNTLINHDLYMMTLTDGKDRTNEEFTNLLENQGFDNITVTKCDTSFLYDAVMAYK